MTLDQPRASFGIFSRKLSTNAAFFENNDDNYITYRMLQFIHRTCG